MKLIQHAVIATLLPTLLGGCAYTGFKSTPWPSSVDVRDREAVEFLRSEPAFVGELGAGLATKSMDSDGQLVGLAISGGGARATAFTLGVLAELANINEGESSALNKIDFISSVSGGGWGAAAYLNDRAKFPSATYQLGNQKKSDFRSAFGKMSGGSIRCWNDTMQKHLFKGRRFADIYGDSGQFDPLPRIFFNAALFPAHAPFVFTDTTLEHYQVEELVHCPSGDPQKATALGPVPFGMAAAISGAVPAFNYAYATTSLCSDSKLAEASFCHEQLKDRRNYLRLADGGLYDNLGFHTAYNVFHAEKSNAYQKRSFILINSSTDTVSRTVSRNDRNSSFLSTIATNGVFASQDSAFQNVGRKMLDAVGVPAENFVLLDFYSLSGMGSDAETLLHGLDHAARYAAYHVDCFQNKGPDNGKIIRGRKGVPNFSDQPGSVKDSLAYLRDRGGDCMSDNFYRAANLGKTTYEIDSSLFTIFWELGQLAVRKHKADIEQALAP